MELVTKEAILSLLQNILAGGDAEYRFIKAHIDTMAPIPVEETEAYKLGYKAGSDDVKRMYGLDGI